MTQKPEVMSADDLGYIDLEDGTTLHAYNSMINALKIIAGTLGIKNCDAYNLATYVGGQMLARALEHKNDWTGYACTIFHKYEMKSMLYAWPVGEEPKEGPPHG